jgi:hypothetical protein
LEGSAVTTNAGRLLVIRRRFVQEGQSLGRARIAVASMLRTSVDDATRESVNSQAAHLAVGSEPLALLEQMQSFIICPFPSANPSLPTSVGWSTLVPTLRC